MMSIILATRDRRAFLPRAIGSVLAQTDPDWELVVLDNGESVADLIPPDPRIVYRHALATGPADAYQQALELATGEIVMPLADDDWLAPETVAVVTSRLDRDWGYARTAFYRNGQLAFYLGDPWDHGRFKLGFFLGGAVFWRKALTDRIGGFDRSFDHAADWDLYLRFAEVCTPLWLPDVLYHYVEHPATDTIANNAAQQVANAAILARLA